MNRLQFESSPYLLQHAANPVDWWPWCEEAIQEAKALDKPILVSIGYSACHWCHVMEHESFENEEVAAFMNEHFICIKVDREERPDIDQIYMDAVQAISGSGGWPLNCFLLPDLKPFFGGTYFPPKPAHNRPSWMEVLQNMHRAFHQKKDVVAEQSQRLNDLIKNNDSVFIGMGAAVSKTAEQVLFGHQQLFEKIQHQFDSVHGGFGAAPKFPGFMSLSFLSQYAYIYNSEVAIDHAVFSFRKMIAGGIYDQLAGGLSRYSVDVAWFAPHFEKMLYDNALFIQGLIELYQHTGKMEFLDTAKETMAFVARELTDEEGGFYSALDADSEGVEGKFYTWTYEELQSVLGEDFEWFALFYGVTLFGNWEESNILARTTSIDEFASEHQLEPAVFRSKLQAAHQDLMKVRDQRIRPGLDDKRLLGWNAMMNIACLRIYKASSDKQYLEQGMRNLHAIERNFGRTEGGMYHVYTKGQASIPAFLEDYAWLIQMYLEWFQTLQESQYLAKAIELASFVEKHFLDLSTGLYFFNADFHSDVLMRKLDLMDNATPSGNAVLCRAYLALGAICSDEEYASKASRMIDRMYDTVHKFPLSFSYWAGNLLWRDHGSTELAILGEHGMQAAEEISMSYDPFRIIVVSKSPEVELELLKYRYIPDETWMYICRNQSCEAPVRYEDKV